MTKLKENKNIFVYAHRGVPTLCQENTMESFKKAVDLKYNGIEMDVLTTKDKKIIVFHDKKINSIDKKIKDLTFKEIKNIYEKKKKPIKVPTLCDVLEKIGHKTVFNIEVKDQGEISQKYVIGKVIELLKRHNLFDNIIISSFNAQILKESKKIDNRYKTAWIWSKKNYRFYNSWKKVLRHYGPDKIHINQSLLTKKIIDKVHKTNREIFAYTVNDKKTLRKLIEMKVDGVFTDSPTILDLSRGTNHQRT